jgi:hypothetical protein
LALSLYEGKHLGKINNLTFYRIAQDPLTLEVVFMFQKNPRLPLDQELSLSVEQRADYPLTEAQREFAEMLGPLLARIWLEENSGKTTREPQQGK